MAIKLKIIIRSILFSSLVYGCLDMKDQKSEETEIPNPYEPKSYVQLEHPKWSINATIYEVNIRQYTPEGTFKAFEAHLPRLKDLGIDILWLMPIHPIGEQHRKGTLGSYYSVKDYYGVNSEFGSEDDFRQLISKIHDLGMYVIIDWVANHSAWDNPLAQLHPDWYTKTKSGNFQPTPWYDWDDIIDFDYNHPGIRAYMTEALKYWVKEFNIDGYRCDVAGFMPLDFWEQARKELDEIKPVFMLAEWESRDLHKQAFDMTYSWSLWNKMHEVVEYNKPINGLIEYMAHDVSSFPRNAYRMTFTDNHDKNSWEGNAHANFGEALEAAIVLSATVKGMPLVYSGQEAGLSRSLKFFDKDLIEWKAHPHAELFKSLFKLKHQNKALWNGMYGGDMTRIFNNQGDKVISFSRQMDGDKVILILNYSKDPVTVILQSKDDIGNYTDWFSQENAVLKGEDEMALGPWEYKLLVQP